MRCNLLFLSLLAVAIFAVAPGASAQLRPAGFAAEPAASESAARRFVVSHSPMLRTLAAVAGSAAGYAYASSRDDAGDDLLVPMAAGAAASAAAALLFSEAHPLKIIVGSALGVLPGGALAHYLSETLEDDVEGNYPLIAFSVPQGLITSAFAQRPRR